MTDHLSSQNWPDQILERFIKAMKSNDYQSCTLDVIAGDMAISVDCVRRYFPTQSSLLDAWFAKIDHAMVQESPEMQADEPVKERLFDLLMTRFEVMQDDKQALSSLRQSAFKDPFLLGHIALLSQRSMGRVLGAAGLSCEGLQGFMRLQALQAVYIHVANSWLTTSEGPELEQTMVLLDRHLSRLDWLAQRLEKIS
jgi:hypothetical protein